MLRSWMTPRSASASSLPSPVMRSQPERWRRARAASGAASFLWLAGALSAQGAVHIVDDDGGAGVAFTEIQPAIDAAAPGDVIVVRAGSYDGFQMFGKPLEVLGEGMDQVTVGVDPATLPVRIEGMPPGNGAALSGLRILADGPPPLELLNNQGRVSLVDLHVSPPPFGPQSSGLAIASSELVLLQSSFFSLSGSGVSPSPAIQAVDSTLWIMDTEIWGANGGSWSSCEPSGPAGAPGISLTDSVLYLADSRIYGGSGGTYYCGPWSVEIPGPAGAGVEAFGASYLKVVSGEVNGGHAACTPAGLGGDAFALFDTSFLHLANQVVVIGNPSSCPGEAVQLSGGAQYVTTSTIYTTLRVDEPVAALGGSAHLKLHGEPAAPAALYASTGFGPVTSVPGVDGATPLDLAHLFPLAALVLDGAGRADVAVPIPVVSGLLGFEGAAQGVVVGSSGTIALSSPAELSIAKGPTAGVPLLATLKTLTGPVKLGASVAGLGDIDSDGLPDAAAGAPYGKGNVLLYSGDGSLIRQIQGTKSNENLGADVANAGDVDGDGVPDQILGAPGADAGKALVLSGATGAVLWTFLGDEYLDTFGERVDGAGDVDLDGVPDLIAGAVFGDHPLTGAGNGHAKVLSGATGLVLHVFGGDFWGGYASDVAGAGDLNQDGVPDLLVGASGDDTLAPERGAVHAYSGADGSELWRVFGDAALDHFGEATAVLDDQDGDGVPEVVAGSPMADAFGFDAGLARVLSGATGATLRDLPGSKSAAELGHAVAGAGDIDGDGVHDVYAGAPYDYEGLPASTLSAPGSATLFSGATGLPLARNFGSTNSFLGSAVAALGDVNGDGIPDLIAGAPGNSFVRFFAGQ